ncbi:MAG: monooxygenase [Rhizobiales bacterium NRL2]|jgi:putative flavoprotein involved in K+ transport|nr:MAG: monooxygenase [Rhizobiales bacterium NRL2]
MADTAPARQTDAIDEWLGRFGRALASGEAAALAPLFAEDCHWRDVVALTWTIGTVSGRAEVASALAHHAAGTGPSGFRAARDRTAPRTVQRAGAECVEAFFDFETRLGRGSGILRLRAGADGEPRAWTLLTALDELKGHEERLGSNRPTGQSHSRDFRGPNWLDQRQAEAAYAEHDPVAIVVGAGQAGLAIAARLGQLGVDTLVVERHWRVGDNWRKRYHALTLHNQVQVNHLPYMPFPPNWPTYIPKDKLAGWFEAYAEAMELNVWTGTEFEGGEWDEAAGRWTVSLRREDGSLRTMNPRHVVMATGVSGIPSRPEIPSLENFHGPVMHSAEYRDGEDFAGRDAIVIGTGNSGHDIAQDLHSSGARVTMVQRNPTMVVNIEPSAQLPYALYSEGPPLEDCDLIVASTPLALARASHQTFTARSRELDRDLLAGLERAGFRLDYGEDDTGWQFKYLTRGGGYYFNVGCSDLIAAGEIGLVQWDEIEGFDEGGMTLRDGERRDADLVVLATGYREQEWLVRRLFGDAVADRVGPVWGFGEDQELRAMFRRTCQPGLWFIAGSLAQCRIYSKYLALQIKALEEGLTG